MPFVGDILPFLVWFWENFLKFKGIWGVTGKDTDFLLEYCSEIKLSETLKSENIEPTPLASHQVYFELKFPSMTWSCPDSLSRIIFNLHF